MSHAIQRSSRRKNNLEYVSEHKISVKTPLKLIPVDSSWNRQVFYSVKYDFEIKLSNKPWRAKLDQHIFIVWDSEGQSLGPLYGESYRENGYVWYEVPRKYMKFVRAKLRNLNEAHKYDKKEFLARRRGASKEQIDHIRLLAETRFIGY